MSGKLCLVGNRAVHAHAEPDQVHMKVGSPGPVGASVSLLAQFSMLLLC